MWDWWSTRRGFSLSSARFSTFFCPCGRPGGTCPQFAERDVKGGEGRCVVKTEGELSDLTNRVCVCVERVLEGVEGLLACN